MNWGKSEKKTTQVTDQTSKQDPWAPTIPLLTSYLGDLDAARSNLGMTPGQADAFASLKAKAAAGHPWATDIGQVATDAFGTPSRAGMVDDAYGAFKTNLGDVAAGKNLDILSDPRLQAILANVGDDVQNRIAGVFAGAGRDVSGNAAGQQAIAKGVTSAQLPLLLQEFSRQQGRTDAAIRDLMSGGVTAAQTGQALDRDALGTRAGGVDIANAALAARDLPENTILNLEQQMKQMPFEDMSLLASILLPVAGLGSQSEGHQTSTGTTKGTEFGIKAGRGDIGELLKTGATLGTWLLSDERAKEDIEPIGKTADGQTIYRYRYKGDPEVQIGLLAQDVERQTPEAVREIGGLKMVDMDKATRRAAMFGSLSLGDPAAAAAIGRMVPGYEPGPRESEMVEDRRGASPMDQFMALQPPRGTIRPEDRSEPGQTAYGMPEVTSEGIRMLMEWLREMQQPARQGAR
jgi:hypothetical protein